MANQMSETKKEFIQKYLLDEYSRAIPTKALPGNSKSVLLGEYSEPKDTRYPHTIDNALDDGNSDSDSGYAYPQDAVIQHRNFRRNSSKDDEGDVYELAKQAGNEYDFPPPTESGEKNNSSHRKNSPHRKPSPKPRGSQTRKSHPDCAIITYTAGMINEPENNSQNVSSDLSKQTSNPAQSDLSNCEGRRRPCKKVVEIEYEMASAIRPVRTEQSSTVSATTQTKTLIKSHSTAESKSSKPSSNQNTTSLPQTTSSFASPKASPINHPNLQHSISQPSWVPGGGEILYEEPWDLKAKRLKQEKEEKHARKLSRQMTEQKPIVPDTSIPVYEQAWDTAAQQKKLEEKLKFARSLSQTSECDVFHDALESVPTVKHDPSSGPPPLPTSDPPGTLKSLPTDTYEDAWDLKNTMLEQRIREMQVQASATYEEPWDRSKQQEQLQAHVQKFSPHTHTKAQPRRCSSEVQEPTCDLVDGKGSITRGKYQSTDENRSKKSKGCNIGQRINPMIPLVNQNWFHGNISRDDAEKMLCVCKEGSYIVRISSDRKSYSLSIKSCKQYIHVQIEEYHLLDGSCRFILGKNSKEFPSIPEMIDYYTHHRVPLKGAEHITLLHPVECKWS